MPVMKVSHGGHESDFGSIAAPFFGEPLHGRHGGENLHTQKIP
jgi:hypothetical protein